MNVQDIYAHLMIIAAAEDRDLAHVEKARIQFILEHNKDIFEDYQSLRIDEYKKNIFEWSTEDPTFIKKKLIDNLNKNELEIALSFVCSIIAIDSRITSKEIELVSFIGSWLPKDKYEKILYPFFIMHNKQIPEYSKNQTSQLRIIDTE